MLLVLDPLILMPGVNRLSYVKEPSVKEPSMKEPSMKEPRFLQATSYMY